MYRSLDWCWLSALKGNPSKDTSWPKNVENVRIFICMFDSALLALSKNRNEVRWKGSGSQ